MLASRTHWRLLIATILVLIAAVWLVPRFVEAPDLRENRVLAQKPAWPRRVQDIAAFRKAADAYVVDNFPARAHLIALLNRIRMLAGVSGSARVIVGRDGWLFFDDDSHLGAARNKPALTGPQIRGWLMTLAGRSEYARLRGAVYLVVTPPYKETIYPEHGPYWYAGPAADRAGVVLPDLAAATGAGEVLSLHPAVSAATRRGEKTYSLHDTHWSGYGAYAGYSALMRRLHAMGLTEGPLPLSAFQRITPTGRGRPRDLAMMLGVASLVDLDHPHFENPAAQAKVRTVYLTPSRDWMSPQILDTGEVGKPVLMLSRDSFSNEMLPFLYSHFSRIVLSHNQDGFWRPDLIDRFKPDVVISEVIEPGLLIGVRAGDGPPPSIELAARIDKVLGARSARRTPAATGAAVLVPPDHALIAALAAAKPTPNCNLEIATLTPGVGGEVEVAVSGWISELGPSITSPEGVVRLRGAGGDIAGKIRVNGKRPDVAGFYKIATGAESGFLGTYFVKKLAPGAYTVTVYRRSPRGWIGCVGKQALIAP